MAKVASHPSRFWLDEVPLACFLTAAQIKITQETPDVTTFCDAGPRRLVGNYGHSGSLTGLFDAADLALDPTLWTDTFADQDRYLAEALGAATEGSICYERVVRLKEQPREAKGGAAVLLNITDEGAGPIVRSKILRSATVSGTGNGTGQNLGTTTSGQVLQVIYRILAITGGAITLQTHESSDDGAGDAYASIAALASGSLSAVGVVRKTSTAASEAWKRITISAMTASSATILATIGVQPNTP